jgi:predicted GNAT superfamily acetyltransferase
MFELTSKMFGLAYRTNFSIAKKVTNVKRFLMEIIVRECVKIDELTACVQLQRDVFGLPEIEISPVRHLVVTKHAGGFTLGAFIEDKLVGFVLSVPGFLNGEKAFYSHMTAVHKDFQSHGIGAKLKWNQRERSLNDGVKFIKWTFQPVQARNAFFNLEKLGAVVKHYEPNFYGTDYSTSHNQSGKLGLDSDRIFAEWNLEADKVVLISNGINFIENNEVKCRIKIPQNWNDLVKSDIVSAIDTQSKIKAEFEKAFAKGLICKGFDRENHAYLLY